MRAPSTRRPDRPQPAASLGPARLTLAFAAVAVAVVTSVASYFSSVEGAEWLSAVSWTAATGFATAGLAYGARRIDRPHGRRAWTLLAVASGAWFAGQLVWDIWIVLDITPATPGIWDLAWIAFALLGMVALTRFAPFPHASRASRLSTAADLAAVYSILTALSILVFYEAAAESSLGLIGKLTSLAYAPMYVALAFTLAQALLGRGVLRLHPKLIALAIGTILTAVAFVLWTPEALSGAYVPGSSPTDAFWTVGGIFLGIAGLLAAGGDPVGLPDKTFLRRRAVVPTAAFVGGLLLLPVLVIWDERQGGVLVMLCGVIAAGLGLALRLGLVARGERQAERKAEEARNELDRFFSSAGDLLAVIGLDGSIRRSNPALERLTGYTSDEVIGSSIAQYIHEEDIRLGAEALERLRQGAASVEWENRLRTRDGEFVPVRWNATAAPEHGVAYTVGLDLRAARRAEAALREAHAQAVQASRLKSDFVANMSHEIRTPLNGVIGMTDLLRHTELTPEQEEYTELIRASGDALLSVINDILDFSKIEAGKLEITRGDFNVRETVDDVWAVVAAAAGVKGLELVSAIDDAVPDWAWGDGARVRRSC